jgi:hypothetical protein
MGAKEAQDMVHLRGEFIVAAFIFLYPLEDSER